MSMDALVGGGVELGEFSLKALAGVEAAFDGVMEQLKKVRRNEEAYQFGAVEVVLRGSATSDSAGDSLEIGLGGPAYGRLWQIRRVAVGGVLWSTSVNGSALLVIGSTKNLNPPLTDVSDEVASLPSNSFYSTGQLVVRHPNHLRVVILSPSATTNYAAGGSATDLPDKREKISVTD